MDKEFYVSIFEEYKKIKELKMIESFILTMIQSISQILQENF